MLGFESKLARVDHYVCHLQVSNNYEKKLENKKAKGLLYKKAKGLLSIRQ